MTFVLLPGAGGDSWYWHLVAPRLRAQGHEVLALDLPTGDDAAGLREYADTVVDAIGERAGLTVVAQSMAAYTAPMLCDRVDVRLLVLVAPMIPAPGESPGEWWSSSGQTAAQRRQDQREGRDPDAGIDVEKVLMHDLPRELVEQAFARGSPASPTPRSPSRGRSTAGRTCRPECSLPVTTACSRSSSCGGSHASAWGSPST